MVVEIRNTITARDLINVTIKAFYERISAKIIVAAGLVISILLVTGIIKLNFIDKLDTCFIIFVLFINLFLPLYLIYYAKNQYSTNKLYQRPMYYTFGDATIIYKGEGAEGIYDWKLIMKYKETKHFLFIYFSSRQLIFIKRDGLTNEQLNFIKSKIKQPE